LNSNFKFQIENWLKYLRSLPDKKKKAILWVIVGILAVILGLFWIKSSISRFLNLGNELENVQLFSIENTETASWIKYVNEEYKFEIKYPEDAFSQEVSTSSAIDIYVNFQTNRLGLRISPWQNKEQYKTIEELISGEREKQVQEKFSVFGTIPQNYTEISLNNAPAIEWNTFHEAKGKIGTIIIALNDGYYYNIVARADPLDGGYLSEFTEENNKIFREILSTFKFLDKPSDLSKNEFSEQFIELTVWPDVTSFNFEEKSFYAKNLNNGDIVKVITKEQECYQCIITKIYSQSEDENKIIIKEFHDFQWLYSTLRDWEGPSLGFTVNGVKEDDHISALEIFYQIQ